MSPKTGTKTGDGRFVVGHDPRRGVGKAGRSGRKPWAFREEMHRALMEGDAGTVVKKIISGDILETLGHDEDGNPIVGETKNADRLVAIKLAASYDIGLPTQPTVDLTPQQPAQLTASALLDAIPRLLGILPGNAQHKAKLLEALEVTGEIVD
jgi:hypothetical protein